MIIQDLKSIKCPIHGEEMIVVSAMTHIISDQAPLFRNMVRAEYHGKLCGCKVEVYGSQQEVCELREIKGEAASTCSP